MPKPSSANKNPVPPDANASVPPNAPARGSLENLKALPEAAPGRKSLASRKASQNSGSESDSSNNSSASAEAVAPEELTFVPSVGPRVSIGAALCEAGFDERAVASQYVKVVQSLGKPDSTDRSGATKLLVDVLKECPRQLDSTGGHRAGDAPVYVQLVHTVSRPVRPAAVSTPALTSANPSPPIEIAAPPADDSSTDIETTNPSTEPS